MSELERERYLLQLATAHLKSAQEEDWDRWERIAGERDRLYQDLQSSGKNGLFPLDSSVVGDLKRIDQEIAAAIQERRMEVLQELDSLRNARQGMAVYRRKKTTKGSGRLQITC